MCNLCFADDFDLMVRTNSELQDTTKRRKKTVQMQMETSTNKNEVMVNSTNKQ